MATERELKGVRIVSMKEMRGQVSCDPSAWSKYRFRSFRWLGICVLAGGLAACAQRQTMYSWNAYQHEVYDYLKADGSSDYAKQAQALEKNVEEARSQNKPLPPGFRAQLGMLYLNMGEGDRAVKEIEGEKLAFPESASFMDFLLRNAKKPVSTEKSGTQGDKAQPIGQKDISEGEFMMGLQIMIRMGVICIATLLTGCAVNNNNLDYTAFRQSKPASILILPPLNDSVEPGAAAAVLSQATFPLAESGYYVFPVAVVAETFKQNGLTAAPDIQAVPPTRLRKIFGADAALYLNVHKY